MQRKTRIDAFGAVSLTVFAFLLAFNQVVIKVVNDGLQPVFFAGIRSAGAVLCLLAWMGLKGQRVRIAPGTVPAGLLIGTLFSAEFLCLFTALDLTTVGRSAIIFYSMPVWLALSAHFLLPGERLTPARILGLGLAFGGVAWAILDRGAAGGQGEASLTGDIFALAAAICWAGIALCVRLTRLSTVQPEMQLMWQLCVSAPILLLAAPFFGPFIRDLAPIHLWGLAFQIVVIVTASFIFWFWLLSIYPASGVTSFSFLSPVIAVLLGWALLGEPVGPSVLVSLGLVACGIVLINRPRGRRSTALPQPAGR